MGVLVCRATVESVSVADGAVGRHSDGRNSSFTSNAMGDEISRQLEHCSNNGHFMQCNEACLAHLKAVLRKSSKERFGTWALWFGTGYLHDGVRLELRTKGL